MAVTITPSALAADNQVPGTSALLPRSKGWSDAAQTCGCGRTPARPAWNLAGLLAAEAWLAQSGRHMQLRVLKRRLTIITPSLA